jgi:hypothetical protein
MNDLKFKNKYLKYKSKYLNLKKKKYKSDTYDYVDNLLYLNKSLKYKKFDYKLDHEHYLIGFYIKLKDKTLNFSLIEKNISTSSKNEIYYKSNFNRELKNIEKLKDHGYNINLLMLDINKYIKHLNYLERINNLKENKFKFIFELNIILDNKAQKAGAPNFTVIDAPKDLGIELVTNKAYVYYSFPLENIIIELNDIFNPLKLLIPDYANFNFKRFALYLLNLPIVNSNVDYQAFLTDYRIQPILNLSNIDPNINDNMIRRIINNIIEFVKNIKENQLTYIIDSIDNFNDDDDEWKIKCIKYHFKKENKFAHNGYYKNLIYKDLFFLLINLTNYQKLQFIHSALHVFDELLILNNGTAHFQDQYNYLYELFDGINLSKEDLLLYFNKYSHTAFAKRRGPNNEKVFQYPYKLIVDAANEKKTRQYEQYNRDSNFYDHTKCNELLNDNIRIQLNCSDHANQSSQNRNFLPNNRIIEVLSKVNEDILTIDLLENI